VHKLNKNILIFVSYLSTIVLNMSATVENLSILEALFGKTRRSILALLFRQPDESFHLRKILRLAGVSPGAGQRELRRLASSGIVLRTERDSRVYFQANSGCPIYIELRSIFTAL